MAKARIADSLRKRVQGRAGERCEYCRVAEAAQVALFECDHCVPESKGGPTSLENLAWACPRCHASKGVHETSIDPQTGEIVRLFHPRQDVWNEHFGWSDDRLNVVGKTATGRATIACLKMNRVKMIQIRRYMIRLRLHPPPDL